MMTHERGVGFDDNQAIAALASIGSISHETVNREKLRYETGYPSSLGPEHARLLMNVHKSDGSIEARIECAIVRDLVGIVTVDAPGVASSEYLSQDYGYVVDLRAAHALHYLHVAWRVVRVSDGSVLYDSLEDVEPSRRVVVSVGGPSAWRSIAQ